MGCYDLSKANTWTVYATSMPSSETQALGDVFVLDAGGSLILTAPGVQFTRYPIAKLENLLGNSNINSADTSSSFQRQRV